MNCISNGNSSSQTDLPQKEDLEDESDSSDDALHSHWSVQHDVHTLSFEDNSFKTEMTLSFISFAALLVNVIARICLKLWGFFSAIFRYSLTRVVVLPDPADDL